jgi:pyruvate kinase
MPILVDPQRLKRRRTKIVATLGPASSDPDTLVRLIQAGVDVFRLNMSHGDHGTHRATYQAVRAAAEETSVAVAVLADLCGPKIRTGRFPGGSVELETDARVTVTTRDVEGSPELIPTGYEALSDDVKPGDRILLDDGNLELRVEDEPEGTEIPCRVVVGGTLKDRKGMNLPGVDISATSLTRKDRADAAFALDLGVDFLALSFVRRAGDVRELRALMAEEAGTAAIVSKIEKPEALEGIDAILDESDAIMVARGDLGVELPPERVPIAQAQLVDLARARGKPVIVATQMLESMIDNPRPTRAEVSDVAGTVWSGTDAVMLSAETAVGEWPLKAVEMMDRIARDTEGYLWSRGGFGSFGPSPEPGSVLRVEDAVARAASQLSRDLMVRAMVVFTRSGRSARTVAAWRPQAPVLARSSDARTCRQLMLSWGVIPVQGSEVGEDAFSRKARELAMSAELAEMGDAILRVSGFNEDPERNEPAVVALRV